MKIDLSIKQVREKLKYLYFPHEIDRAIELIIEIRKLKKEKNVVILGHNYMTPDVYWGISDFVGDSLFLSKMASKVEADMILFNGVYFMAETAKILNPEKKVLISDKEAGCSLAESITASDVRGLKEQFPGIPVVTYINSTAEVKAESDVCCTSANALEVIENIDSEKVIFLPDVYLGKNLQNQTKKQLILWEKGKCIVHEQYTKEDIEYYRKQFEDLLVIAHPECSPEVIEVSDFSGSTSQMASFIEKSSKKNVLLVTECGMADNLRSEFPEKNFIGTCHTCPHMKKITLKKIYDALQEEKYEVHVPEDIAIKARSAIEKMFLIPTKRS
ncbi:MAG: quinolinate synthase NadA [Leptospiraceae bacterium]|nr:quinolinate synthase NadA [Leptospiraceae bacterium]MDW7976522.1 quinolinate synthase NadA [Leptospiraceae bacterium]